MRAVPLARIKGIGPGQFYSNELESMPTPKRSTGWTDGGHCPFHTDTHTGNFRVNLDTGAFKCFACGVKGGDIVAFTQTRLGVSFQDALKVIAESYGVQP